MTETKQKNRD